MTDFVPLKRSAYLPSAKIVAPHLLGHWLIRHTPQGLCGGQIVETEAYLRGDAACHAARGLTGRTEVMFGPPGHAYVYFIYGAHFCVNAVCMRTGLAEAVLIRAIEPTLLPEVLAQRRPGRVLQQLTNGPAKLCEALDIDRKLNGVDLCDDRSPLFIAQNRELRSFRKANGPVKITRRIGISQAAELPLRFCLAGSIHVSRKPT